MLDGDGWGWGGWLAMCTMVLFWAALITAVVVAIRYLSQSQPRGRTPTPALTEGRTDAENVLAGRFARGEIDEDEYRRRVAVLSEH